MIRVSVLKGFWVNKRVFCAFPTLTKIKFTPTKILNKLLTTTGEALDYKKDSKGKKPVDVVISAFTNDDISSLAALEGEEILAAASYAPDNARLSKTAENQYKIGKLVSLIIF